MHTIPPNYNGPYTVVCTLAADPTWIPIPGSTRDVCQRCAEAIFVAPTTRAILRDAVGVHVLWCLPCFVEWRKAGGAQALVAPLTEAQRAEIRAARQYH